MSDKSEVEPKEEYESLSLIAKIGLLAIGLFASFSYPMQILPIKLVLVFLVAMLSNSAADTYQIKNREDQTKLWIFKTVVVILGFFCTNKTISHTKSLNQGFLRWEGALNSHQYGDYKGAIQVYESIYTIFKNDGDFLMNYGKTLAIEGEYDKAIAILEQAKYFLNTAVIATALGDSYKATQQYDKAEVAYRQATNMIPSQFYPNYLLAKLYDDLGQESKATAMAEKILNKKIKIPSTAIKEIRAAMKKILTKYKNPPGFKN